MIKQTWANGNFFDLELARYGGEVVFLGNLDKIDTKKHFQTSDIFVNEILLIWAEVNLSKIFLTALQNTAPLEYFFDKNSSQTCIFSRMACKRNFDSRLSYKRRHQFPLLCRVFKQISLQKLPTCLQWVIATLKKIRESFKENIDNLETVETESFIKAFPKTRKRSKLTYRNLVPTKSEKPIAS